MMINEEQLVASISETMSDFQIAVSDLKAPTTKFVQSYLIRFLLELGVDAERFHLTKKQSTSMTSPSSIQHMVPLFQLFGVVAEITKCIGMQDFSFSDITQPKSKRIVTLVNLFDRFYAYADMLAERVQDDMEKLTDRKQEYNNLLAQVHKLQDEVEYQGNMPAMNDILKQEIEELKKKLVHKRQETSEIVVNTDNVDSAVEENEKKQKKLTSEYDKMKDELETLRARTVHSPDVDQMDLKLRNLEKQKSESKRRIQDLQSCVQKKSQQINVFKKYICDLEQGMQDVETIVQLHKQNKMLGEEIQVLTEKDLVATNKEIDLKEKLTKMIAEVKQLNKQKRMTKQELVEQKKKMEEVQKELAEMRKKGESCVNLRKKIYELENQIKQKVADNNKVCDLYEEMYKERIEQMNGELDRMGLLTEDEE